MIAGPASDVRERAAALLCALDGVQVDERALETSGHEYAPDELEGAPDVVVLASLESAGSARALGAPVIGMCERVDSGDIARWLDAGASDVVTLADPVPLIEHRVRALAQTARAARRTRALAAQGEALARIHAISAEQGDSVDALRQILGIALQVMGFDRACLVAHVEGSDAAYVVAATDAPEFAQFAVAIDKYPEIRAALESAQPVLLHDAQNDPLTASVADLLAQVEVRGMAVFPAVWMGTPLGVLMFRKRDPGVEHLDGERQAFAMVLARHLAVCLHHGKVMESLRASTTHRMSRSRYEAERRLRTIDSLKEHFEASADGVLILDENGRLIFINRAGEAILGFRRDEIMGREIESFVRDSDETLIRKVIARVIQGQNIGAFDLDLVTCCSGSTICASVTTSTVLGSAGAAVLSFRDVTAQRALEAELRHTKEFLEKLVDSTVDAIIAADMRGNVIIFNKGAERIHGYTAEEVIGRIPVSQLYPDGVARQVMRMLRSTQYGGVGRLEQTRREIKSKTGELVPVNMTASIIYQEGSEVATVGIFSDLRERIRIEQRLLQAQEKLQMTEKQALVAELAGVTAHELNQPLTSIIGYADWLLQRGQLEPSIMKPVRVILDEAERMAEIVKKIGKITKYETKLYMGSTRMLDLDRSSRAATAEPAPVILSSPVIVSEDPVVPGDLENFEDEITGEVSLAELERVVVRSEDARATDLHAPEEPESADGQQRADHTDE